MERVNYAPTTPGLFFFERSSIMGTKPHRIFMILLTLLSLLTINGYAEQSNYKGYPRGNTLITVQELKRLIDAKDPKLVVLAAENSVEYRLGHIPGSHQVDRPNIEAPPETQNGITGNIIDTTGFTKLVQNLGINGIRSLWFTTQSMMQPASGGHLITTARETCCCWTAALRPGRQPDIRSICWRLLRPPAYPS